VAPQPRGSRPRHVPQRTCVACRQTGVKRELVRIVRGTNGSVTVDPTGKRSGRGAYLHSTAECWSAGLSRSLLARALKIEAISEDDLAALNEYAERSSSSSAHQ
jgi:predicted RNA-binding protein YlxR (DUF448 family)